MSYNGSGTFQINTSGQPVVAGTVISSTAFNALTADLATGLSTAITKDGQTTTTARIPFAAGINSSLTTDSTNSTSGSIITAGGVGVAKALFVGTTANVAGAVTLQSTLGVTGVATFSAAPIYSSLTASSAVATDASKALVSVTNTGTGNNVLATSPTITTPTLSGDTIAGTINGLTVGKGAGAVATNTAVGASAIAATATATRSTAIGFEALKALTSGDPNTAVGAYALNKNTTGAANVGVGAYALEDNTTGSNNSVLGNEALPNNTTGGTNTAVGAGALFTNTTASGNTALGYQAGYTNTTGAALTHIGYQAGYSASIASGNTFVGYQAGYAATQVSGTNTCIGYQSGNAITTGINHTIIGRYSGNGGGLDIRTASNYIVLSDGDANPRGIFDNFGGFMVGGSVDQTNAGFGIAFNSPAYLGDNYGRMVVKKTFSGSVTGVAFLHDNGAVGTISYSNSATAYNTSSDYRLKNTIAPMTGALAKVAQLKPVTYKWNIDNSNSEGFIAHELAEICPLAVTGTKDAIDEFGNPVYQGIDTSFLVATLTAAIQEQQALITQLQADVAALKGASA